jgi:hypothetical protein
MFLKKLDGTPGTLTNVQVWNSQDVKWEAYAKTVFSSFDADAVSANDRIDVFNLLRFPKSSIRVALEYLEALKQRSDWAGMVLSEDQRASNEQCIKGIVSQFGVGPMAQPGSPTPLAAKVYAILYSPFIKSILKPEVLLTLDSDYRRMMANEFHAYDEEAFDPSEPLNYLKRLTTEQKSLLFKADVPVGRLTAFVVFGDGYALRLMGGVFREYIRKGALPKITDHARPNASFALFNRTSGTVSELVFYTRFLCISYRSDEDYSGNYRGYKGARRAKLASRALFGEDLKAAADYASYSAADKSFIDSLYMLGADTLLDADTLIGIFFEELSRMELLASDFAEVTDADPERFYLNHESGFGGTFDLFRVGIDLEVMVPFLTILNSQGGTPDVMILPHPEVVSEVGSEPDEYGTNTIHGTLNTLGCWMLLRNYVWNWPRENHEVGGKYTDYNTFSEEYRKYWEAYDSCYEACCEAHDDCDDPADAEQCTEQCSIEALSSIDGSQLTTLELPTTSAFTSRGATGKKRILLNWWKNLTYFEFINRFVGYDYTGENKYHYSFPANTDLDRSGSNTGDDNLYQGNATVDDPFYRYERADTGDLQSRPASWSDLYLFKRTIKRTEDDRIEGFTGDKNDATPFS